MERFGLQDDQWERIDPDNEYMMIDATMVRPHQHSAGARKKTASKRSADRAADSPPSFMRSSMPWAIPSS